MLPVITGFQSLITFLPTPIEMLEDGLDSINGCLDPSVAN
jgi:hypothetical protein